jgi:hypothetical protein
MTGHGAVVMDSATGRKLAGMTSTLEGKGRVVVWAAAGKGPEKAVSLDEAPDGSGAVTGVADETIPKQALNPHRSTIMKTNTSCPTVVTLLLLGGSLAPAAAQDAGPAATQICLAPATVEAATNGADLMSAVRDAFTSFLNGPTLGVKPLSARLQSQVRQEAKLAGCAYLLLITAKHERKTGSGVLAEMASGAAQHGAWAVGGAAGTSVVSRAVAGAVVGAASSSISDYAMSSKQKDELTLSWRLESATGQVLVEKSEKRKAKADGEDLLTPLAQVAAESIAAAAVK